MAGIEDAISKGETMDKVSVAINGDFQDDKGSAFTISNICVEINLDGTISTVIRVYAAGEFNEYRLPDHNDYVKSWRPVK
jgi:hypothetical protein